MFAYTNIKNAIAETAPMGKAVTAAVANVDKTIFSKWKILEEKLSRAMTAYYTAMQCDNLPIVVENTKNEVFTALKNLKEYAGYTFTTAPNEPELLITKMFRDKAIKDENGLIVSRDTVQASVPTMRRNLEWYLYARDSGILGKTAEEYQKDIDDQRTLKRTLAETKKAFGRWVKEHFPDTPKEWFVLAWEATAERATVGDNKYDLLDFATNHFADIITAKSETVA